MKPNTNKTVINTFLKDLKQILDRSDFNINTDFIMIIKNKPDDIEHSTKYTLLDLEYDAEDVVEELRTLTLEHYSETLLDQDNSKPPFLYVFGKRINKKPIYIKLKIKEGQRKHVLCVSFHYAKDRMLFPYAMN